MMQNSNVFSLPRNSVIALYTLLLFSVGFLYCGETDAGITNNSTNFNKSSSLTKQMSWQRHFDEQDRLDKIIDPAGRETRIEYNTGNMDALRITKIPPEGKEVVWEFDKLGRLDSMSDDAGKVKYSHDDFGRLQSLRRQGSEELSYSYDTQGRVTTLRIGNFYGLKYGYDFLGRIATIKTPVGTISYEYLTGQGILVRTLPNKVRTTWEYTTEGRLSKLTHSNASRVIIVEYRYKYRSDGLISAIGEQTPYGTKVTRYKYDKTGSLVSAADQSGRKYSYQYDQLGNRISSTRSKNSTQTYSNDWFGRLTHFNNVPTEHDAAGNLTKIKIDDTPLHYRYNSDGRITQAGNQVSYLYDGNGRLIERQKGKEKTTFITNPFSNYWQPLVMDNNTSGRTLLIWDKNTPLMIIRDGKPEFYLHDHLGSVRFTIDIKGNIQQKMDYDPFGVMLASLASSDFAPRYAGLFWDSEAQAYMTLARAYSPYVGQFLQPDPLKFIPTSFKSSLPQYAYSTDNPINLIDNTGNSPETPPYHQRLKHDLGILKSTSSIIKSINEFRGPPTQYFGKFNLGASLAQDFTNVFHSSQTPWQKFQNIGLLGQTSEWSVKKYAKFSSPFSGEMIGLGFDVIRQRSFSFSPDVAEHIMDTVFGGTAYGLGYVLGGGPVFGHALGSAMGKVATSIPDVPRKLLKPLANPRVTGSEHTGRWLYQASSALLRNNKDYFLNKHGDVFNTVISRNKPRRSAYHARQLVAIKDFQLAFNQGDTAKISNMLRNNRQIINLLNSAGVSDKNINAIAQSLSIGRKTMSPSNVGGVYLDGANKALEGIGQLDGIVLDSNNNLILLAQSGQKIGLPPLRLDDLVTVFRSVYIYGEGPSVTIDPNPKDPENSAMIIGHGKATEDTYVGWILYQADRLMKGYSVGVDNISGKPMASTVTGYDDVLETLYFGSSTPESSRKKGLWERFWIVPAEANHFSAKDQNLTLFDVPLKVNTQLMKWKNGKLVNNLNGQSSAGASKFVTWFTKSYEAIAKEQFLTPPIESGIDKAVPVFTELRRITLMTAIAEKLRNQGTPMPFWMRDYQVRLVPFEKITPGIKVTRTKNKVRAQVFGGVRSSPDSSQVRQFVNIADLQKLPKAKRKLGKARLKQANALSKLVRDEISTTEPLKLHQLSLDGKTYQALPVPGFKTSALNPVRLNEVDLIVPITGGRELRLSRHYHSFFNPSGPWGKTWIWDLPQLKKIRIPVQRQGDKAQYRIGYELLTPLDSVYARFSEIKPIAALNNSRLMVPDTDSDFFGLADAKLEFLKVPTDKLLGKHGENWHFFKTGTLAVVEKSGFRTVYLRNKDGTVSKIVGLLGLQQVASITLQYKENRLIRATGKNVHGKQSISYQYNNEGKLIGVKSDQGKRGYRYQDLLVTAVTWQDASATAKGQPKPEYVLHQFKYNSKGQLLTEILANDQLINYGIKSENKKNTVTVKQEENSLPTEFVQYDDAYRPQKARYSDGTQASWLYPKTGEKILKLQNSDEDILQITESADRRQKTYKLTNQPLVKEEYDQSGRLIALLENGQTLLRQNWSSQGRLLSLKTGDRTTRFRYQKDGLMNSIFVSPSGVGDNPKEWQQTKLNSAGQPINITDYRGLNKAIHYNELGGIDQVVTQRDGKNYGFGIIRDKNRRVKTVNSSWDKQQFSYATDGSLSSISIEKTGSVGTENMLIKLSNGRPLFFKNYDGGKIILSYYDKGQNKGLLKHITHANKLSLDYKYDSESRLTDVEIGKQRQISLKYDKKNRVVSFTSHPSGK